MPAKHIFLAILVAVIWGGNFIFVTMGVHEVPPLFLCAVRFLLASIPAIFFIRCPVNAFKMVVLYGIIMFALQFSLIFTGIAVGMPAGMASLLLQSAVFFSIFFAAIFIREIPTFWQMTGALLSFSGIALAATHLDSTMTLEGFLLVMGGAIASGFGNLIARKLGHVNMAALVGWSSFIACPLLFIASWFIEGPDQIQNSLHHISWPALISLLYIVYISTWVGYGTWSWLLARYPVSTVVSFSLLIPIFAMLGSTLVLGESFEPWKMTVSGLVIAGLCVNLLVPRIIARRKASVLKLNVSET